MKLSNVGSLTVSAVTINYITRLVCAIIYYALNGTLNDTPSLLICTLCPEKSGLQNK